jgi:hypothetical protein
MATPEKQPGLSFFCLIFMSLRSKPLEGHRQADFFLHLKQAARRTSRARCVNYFIVSVQTAWVRGLTSDLLYLCSARKPALPA